MRWSCLIVAALCLASCGEDPEDVAGEYSINLTNGENGCNFDNWTVGESTTNIPLTITQDGGHATATLGGAVAVYLDLALGSHVYSGSVDGSHLSLAIYGTRSATTGSCAYTVNSFVEADLDVENDLLAGTVRYDAATNGSPDCGSIQGCSTRQSFNGLRPPAP
jgi:hypothetical protein